MEFRTRLSSWSLPVLLFGVPLCAALALEHAGAAGEKAFRARALSATPVTQASPLEKTAPPGPAQRGPQIPHVAAH